MKKEKAEWKKRIAEIQKELNELNKQKQELEYKIEHITDRLNKELEDTDYQLMWRCPVKGEPYLVIEHITD